MVLDLTAIIAGSGVILSTAPEGVEANRFMVVLHSSLDGFYYSTVALHIDTSERRKLLLSP